VEWQVALSQGETLDLVIVAASTATKEMRRLSP
jgi:hypothetical protein